MRLKVGQIWHRPGHYTLTVVKELPTGFLIEWTGGHPFKLPKDADLKGHILDETNVVKTILKNYD